MLNRLVRSIRDSLHGTVSCASLSLRLRLPSPTLFLSLVFRPVLSSAEGQNITVDDTSGSIVYTPPSSWHASSSPCSICLQPGPGIAHGGTWHEGLHLFDADDHSSNRNSTQNGNSPGQGDADEDSDGSDSEEEEEHEQSLEGSSHTKSARRASGAVSEVPSSTPRGDRFSMSNFERDDAGPVDIPVSAQFNFTGSAIYVYAIVPHGVQPANSAPTATNLTFLLDSRLVGAYQHAGTASATAFLPSQLVFVQGNLPGGPHTLTIQIGPNSVLLLDYIIYTEGNISGGGSSSNMPIIPTSTAPGARESGSGTGSTAPSGGPGTANLPAPAPKSNNIATFAGAVGGSVGLLTILALSLAISIYRRRVRAARRDRHFRQAQNVDFDGESFHTDASEDSPPMAGPAPFIPRYFPGTVVPAPPPPYSPPSEQTAALLAGASPISSPLWAPPRLPGPGEDTSYADRPPPTPPPMPEDGLDDYFAPPSFPQAISSPIPAMLAGYAPVSTSSAPVSASPVPRHANGPESRGVYAVTAPPPPRPREDPDSWSQRSDWSDRPPSFASQAPPLLPPPPRQPQQGSQSQGQGDGGLESGAHQQEQQQGVVVERQQEQQRTSDEDRNSVRSARSR